MEDNITISRIEYVNMRRDQLLLESLRDAGVDNWEGWDYAVDDYTILLEEKGLEEDED